MQTAKANNLDDMVYMLSTKNILSNWICGEFFEEIKIDLV